MKQLNILNSTSSAHGLEQEHHASSKTLPLKKQKKELKNMKYNIVNNDGSEHAAIEIAEGKFSGIAVQYGIIKVEELNENLVLNFNYDIVKGDVSDADKDQFNQIVGDILVKLLEERDGTIGDNFDGEVIEDDGISYIEESGDE